MNPEVDLSLLEEVFCEIDGSSKAATNSSIPTTSIADSCSTTPSTTKTARKRFLEDLILPEANSFSNKKIKRTNHNSKSDTPKIEKSFDSVVHDGK